MALLLPSIMFFTACDDEDYMRFDLSHSGVYFTKDTLNYSFGVTPVEITDDKVSFQLTAAYADPGTKESLGEGAFDFEMILTNGHWVMTKYELWF